MSNKVYTLDMFGVNKHEFTLDNGLKTIFIEKPYSPIYAKMMFKAGAVFHEMDSGLAHLTEHLIMNGTREVDEEQLARLVDAVGGYTNASTSMGVMAVKAEIVLADQLPTMRDFFQHVVGELYVTEQSLSLEKKDCLR